MHPDTSFLVEFPAGPLGLGADVRIRPVELQVGRTRLLALSATDSCRDRLASFYHWSDRQSLAAAVAIARRHEVNLRTIRKWSRAEGAMAGLQEFLDLLESRRAPAPRSANAPRKRRST